MIFLLTKSYQKANIILDPDCGLRRASSDVAFDKLRLMNEIKDKYS